MAASDPSTRAPASGRQSPKRRTVIHAALDDVRRVSEITSVMTRHGLAGVLSFLGLEPEPSPQAEPDAQTPEQLGLDAAPSRLARRVRRVLEELGPTSIKLGQILSTRPDLLPPVYIQELKRLQDMAPAVPFGQIRQQVESSLGRPLEEMFLHFDGEPLAVASMAQVHRAQLFDGRQVVVKVQRPDIERMIRSDMSVLYYLARLGEATIEEVGLYNPVAIVKEFEKAITQELNFLIEAQNTRQARANSASLPGVVIPEVIDALSSASVITQTFIEGSKLDQLEVSSQRAQRLCRVALEAAFKQIFEDGFFHGDPHPGNMLITPQDEVVFLDWGLVGRLSTVQREQLVELLFALVTQDIDGITRMVLRMGAPDGRVSMRALREEVERLYGEHLVMHGTLSSIDVASLMEDIMGLSHTYRIRINPQYALLAKATATVEGVLRAVHPQLDVVQTLRPFGQRLMLERMSSERLAKGVVTTLVSANHLLRELPLQLDQILMDVEGGELRVQVSHPQLDLLSGALSMLGSRIFLGFMAGALIIGGCVLLTTFDWRPLGVPMLVVFAAICFLAAGGFAFAALSWHFLSGGLGKVKLAPWLKLWRRR